MTLHLSSFKHRDLGYRPRRLSEDERTIEETWKNGDSVLGPIGIWINHAAAGKDIPGDVLDAIIEEAWAKAGDMGLRGYSPATAVEELRQFLKGRNLNV